MVELSYQYYYLLPIAIVVATLANYSGIGGATFFAPLFIIGLGLDVPVSFGVAIITEFFGFGSGVFGYIYRRLVDFQIVGMALVVTIPLAILGVNISYLLNHELLHIIFLIGLTIVALLFFKKNKSEIGLSSSVIKDSPPSGQKIKTHYYSNNKSVNYISPNMKVGVPLFGFGGLLLGLLSSGCGETNALFLIKLSRIPIKIATGTSVVIIAITALSSGLMHISHFSTMSFSDSSQVLSIIIFTIPGVIIGGQLGPILADKFQFKYFEKFIGCVFLIIVILCVLHLCFHQP